MEREERMSRNDLRHTVEDVLALSLAAEDETEDQRAAGGCRRVGIEAGLEQLNQLASQPGEEETIGQGVTLTAGDRVY
jgi:hypothetical protein